MQIPKMPVFHMRRVKRGESYDINCLSYKEDSHLEDVFVLGDMGVLNVEFVNQTMHQYNKYTRTEFWSRYKITPNDKYHDFFDLYDMWQYYYVELNGHPYMFHPEWVASTHKDYFIYQDVRYAEPPEKIYTGSMKKVRDAIKEWKLAKAEKGIDLEPESISNNTNTI